MASSGAAGQTSAPAMGPGHWQAKTASAGFPKYVVGSNFYQASYAYTDASTVTMTKVLNSDGSVYAYRAQFYDSIRGTNQRVSLFDNPAGVQNFFQVSNYTGPDKVYTANYTTTDSYGGPETTATYLYPGTNDGTTMQSTVASTAAFRSINDIYTSEYGYFYGLGFTAPN